ncbi:MAG TPA: SAM-dependent methyltransferase [Thermoanaerobaculia bacterium]|jgi:SAM-dependent MidA family methyltransferase|nr:SAM-dependent methyltransferase [Thermoanaerobaculia bacterium]
MPTPADRLRVRIRAEGPIPFAAFMEEALYGEDGYYNRPDPPIGEAGDFVTGASFSPLFGRATARLLRRLDRALGRPAELFEAGYGTGAHLGNVLAALQGEDRRVLAWDRVARPAPTGVERKERLEDVGPVEGLVFSYELFDALPVHRLIGRESGVGELWVDLDAEGGFLWKEAELSDPALPDLLAGSRLEPGQIADLAPGWVPLYREVARRLGRGLLVTCDYGFDRERLLDVRIRRHGTLACFSRQRVHRNPFVLIGEQDLTAHVDFTALIRAGEEAGLTTVALTRQALWLTACGLFDDLQDATPEARQEAMTLLDGEGMGEDIRVLVQAKGIDPGEVLDLRMLGRR